ncbi:uncharacterized protein LOC123536694 [Mercenaria mercenaria]|uniref:uncharacterized protein LOC123536694 n=1 Tax=Mercenaria mercenaria TaxID=6596 RepID=UPI001E1DEEA3|nr:uncharacterized protein LOC123536694 [Mercenaria mercenaria]
MVFGRISLLCIVIVGASKFDGLGVHVETLDNLVFGDKTLINEKYPVRSVTSCALLCRKYAECMSFTVNTNVEKCRIYSSAVHVTQDGTAGHGWKYYVFGDARCRLKDGFIYSRIYKMCIHLSTQAFLYESGNIYCTEKGSRLVSINTTEKVNAIANMLNTLTSSDSFLIGLRYSDGHWRWQDGAVLGPEANWGDGRPRTGNGYECAHVIKSWGYKYEDHACYAYLKRVICEYILQ